VNGGKVVLPQRDIGERIRRLRLVAGVGQVEFASRLGIANGSVSKIENGRMTVSDDLLDRIAVALDCAPDYLAAPERIGPTTRPWLRAYADASKRTVDQQAADCATAIEVSDILGLRRIPDGIPIFDGDLSDDDAIEQFALDVRAAAQIGDCDVVGNCIRAAERLGCVVLPMRNELGRHLGLSLRSNLIPVICVSQASTNRPGGVPGDRQRFTVAHELGHLGLHAGLGPPESADDATRVEKQAHRFAGAFLGPGDALLQDLQQEGGRITLRTLTILKERWGISIKALVMRFQALGVIDADHARSLYKQISARGWNKAEPIDVGGEEAIWLNQAIKQFSAGAADGLGVAAQSAGIGRSYFQRWTEWNPLEHSTGDVARVFEIGSKARKPAKKQRGRRLPADVVSLSPRRR
jgi:Zn-dependent peptidase ImmA (M78 family)/transcriptional regulator with XRE-family HTH domain